MEQQIIIRQERAGVQCFKKYSRIELSRIDECSENCEHTRMESGRKWCEYYYVTVEGNEYTLIEGLSIDKDKTVYHEMTSETS